MHAPLANADPDEPPTFELLTLVAEWLDTREFVSFAAVSKECRVAAHWQLHAALLAALRLSLRGVVGAAGCRNPEQCCRRLLEWRAWC